jgi:hypothetical protein
VTSGRCWPFRHAGSSQPVASTTPTTSHDQPNTQDPVSAGRLRPQGAAQPAPTRTPVPDGLSRHASRVIAAGTAGLHGNDSGHERVDPPPAMTVFFGERLTAGASEIAGKQPGSGAVRR